ncbi:hypothetical protein IJM86_01275 [bacterium]|nr:hypothetical protein [bacterium]
MSTAILKREMMSDEKYIELLETIIQETENKKNIIKNLEDKCNELIKENQELRKALLEVSRLAAELQQNHNYLYNGLENVKYMVKYDTEEEIEKEVDNSLIEFGKRKNPNAWFIEFTELSEKY